MRCLSQKWILNVQFCVCGSCKNLVGILEKGGGGEESTKNIFEKISKTGTEKIYATPVLDKFKSFYVVHLK